MSKIKTIKRKGKVQTYDLEVESPDHQFYLENGVLTSNSHSISYSHISYYTAWLRCHYPTEFMCALINNEDPNSDKTQEYLDECKNMGIEIKPPDILTSKGAYVVTGNSEITTGLSAIKGVGEKAVGQILEAQPFPSFAHFFANTEGRVVNKRVIQAMVKAGAYGS